jgi:A118 family predicted phage portal protein
MLPNNNMKLPPENMEKIYAKFEEYLAWYQDDVAYLKTLTYTNASSIPERRFSYYENSSNTATREYLHIPLAGDISSTASSLILGDEIDATYPGAKDIAADPTIIATQERLDYIIEKGKLHNRLLEAVEISSVLGGVYLKVDWDKDIVDVPFLSVVASDMVIPRFRYDFLIGVTFMKVIDVNDEVIYRLVEDREKGKISYGLFKGLKDNLGYQIPLSYHLETVNLPEEINTGIDDLLVRYIPNAMPNKQCQTMPIGKSDYSGLGWLFNAIDITYTAWLREIRLCQSRIIVPETWLQRDTTGGLRFDVDREIFTTLDIDPLSGQGLSVVQFELRVQQYYETCLEFMKTAISMAGFSPNTFGLGIDGNAESGTALNIRERKTLKKIRKSQTFLSDNLEDLLQLLLLIDNDLNNSGNLIDEKPQVDFQDSMAFDMSKVADTLDKLNRAQAISIQTKTQLLHPQWNVEEINEEVERIMSELGIMTMDMQEEFSIAEDNEEPEDNEDNEDGVGEID